MKLAIFGSGYVGLVTGACLADIGHDVVCIDRDQSKIDSLNNGQIPIYEPGLEEKVKINMQAGRLSFAVDPKDAIERSAVIFIAVGTPPDEDGSADLSAVLAVSKTIAEHMNGEKVVVTKSTVPVGSADQVRAALSGRLKELNKDLQFYVASNPEFLKEGNAVEDFERPDRIIIGIDHEKAEKALEEIYAPFCRREDRIISMDIRSAELTKYAANAMLATKISFMNEMANIAERVGADIEQVRIGIGSDKRIGTHFIYPGVGYGGSCFPKDVKALAATAKKNGMNPHVINAVETVNENQKSVIVQKIKEHFSSDLSGKTFAVWGLAFKPNTDDMREAPARVIMEQLWALGAKVRAYDPEAMEECTRIYGKRDDLELCNSPLETLEGADAVLLVTEWKEFRAFPYERAGNALTSKVMFDGRNLYAPEKMRENGFAYYGIGRP